MTKTLAELPAITLAADVVASGQLPDLLAQAAAAYGPIFKWVIPAGWDAGEYVFMVGPEANRFVLHTGRAHFSHAQGWTPIIGDSLGNGLLNMDDPEHARHRKMWNPAFTSAAMEAYLPIIRQVVAARTADWAARGEVDLLAETRTITFDCAAAALAGLAPSAEVDRLRRLFQTLIGEPDSGVTDWSAYEQTWQAARVELGQTLSRLIHERRAMPDTAQPHDVVGLIVRARDDDGQALSDAQILAHINILLVAGHETTTTLAAWTLATLVTEPGWRAAIAAELAERLGSVTGELSVEAVRQLRQLDAFIKETGRLYPPVLNVPRGVVTAFDFGGYQIPAGTPVRLALAATHRLPSIFREPLRFDPARFLPPRDEDRATPYGLVTFGGGPRVCIGISFAQIEVKALAAHVVGRYDLTLVPGQHPTHAGHWTATVPGGIRVQVRAR